MNTKRRAATCLFLLLLPVVASSWMAANLTNSHQTRFESSSGARTLQQAPRSYNYAEALRLSWLFYAAQRSGPLPRGYSIKWRGNSFLAERAPTGERIIGGWFDAGDHVKFMLPQAWTVMVLAWGLHKFPEGHKASRQYAIALNNLRWGADFLMRCNLGAGTAFVGQVGNPSADHAVWRPPEGVKGAYPVYVLNASRPGSDVAGLAAAALAATSVAIKPTHTAYAARALKHARQVYSFATRYKGKYHTSIPSAKCCYSSVSFYDDLSVAAAWLYKATKEARYLREAQQYYDIHMRTEAGAWTNFDWDNQEWATDALLAELLRTPSQQGRPVVNKYSSHLQKFVEARLGGRHGVQYAPNGMTYQGDWGPLRYNANAQFLLMLIAKDNLGTKDQKQLITCHVLHQMGKILGDTGRSYVVGFGTNPPCRPHHRAASCPGPGKPCGPTYLSRAGCNPNKLLGALVGGPTWGGRGKPMQYADVRTDYQRNEVAIDYNAGYTGALAALLSNQVISKTQCAARGLMRFPAANV